MSKETISVSGYGNPNTKHPTHEKVSRNLKSELKEFFLLKPL